MKKIVTYHKLVSNLNRTTALKILAH
uniref:Uncharacterized protein n=1 Tax=Lepeophtheirus salmonis TaxID=72036 RepID=A0A0K2T601_LEPSM